MDTPLISIIVPTYNRADLIGEALESVLAQSFSSWELIIMDDCSTDNTAAIVRQFLARDSRIRYIKNEKNLGIARNRNTGIELTKGSLIAMLDSDDTWTDKNKLQKQADFLRENPDHVLVSTRATVIDLAGKEVGKFDFAEKDEDIRKVMLRRNQIVQSSVLYRKDSAVAVGGYDPSYAIVDDYDLWLRLGSEGRFRVLPEYMVGYRAHDGGITKERPLVAAREHLAIIRKHKNAYPGYAFAYIKAKVRIVIARIKARR
ncbi:MAG: glycosyltransferase [bacterium]|nr:glycosyltransferase [bacterium]